MSKSGHTLDIASDDAQTVQSFLKKHLGCDVGIVYTGRSPTFYINSSRGYGSQVAFESLVVPSGGPNTSRVPSKIVHWSNEDPTMLSGPSRLGCSLGTGDGVLVFETKGYATQYTDLFGAALYAQLRADSEGNPTSEPAFVSIEGSPVSWNSTANRTPFYKVAATDELTVGVYTIRVANISGVGSLPSRAKAPATPSHNALTQGSIGGAYTK